MGCCSMDVRMGKHRAQFGCGVLVVDAGPVGFGFRPVPALQLPVVACYAHRYLDCRRIWMMPIVAH